MTLRVAIPLILIVSFVLPLSASSKARVRLPEKYARWLNEEVTYIISDEERKEFLALTSDSARDSFIKEFWEVRNPIRGSERNPFKEEHYIRLEYANQNFGRESNTPGWKTDMGRTYILFGKPQSRAPFKGYGQIYPLELWFYSNNTGNPSLPPFFYILFFMPEGIGEYRYYRPNVDGPLKLVRGSRFQSNRDVYYFLKPLGGDLAHAAFSLVPSEPIDTQDFTVSLGSDMLVSKIQDFANDPFQLSRIRELRYLREKVQSWILMAGEQPLQIASIVLSDLSGNYWLDYGVLINDEKLGRPSPGDNQLIVSSGYRLLNDNGSLIVEDYEERSYPAYGSSSGEKRFLPFILANRIPLVPGKYRLEIELTNREAGRIYKGERAIQVADRNQAMLRGPLLAASVQQVNKPDALTPFQYFGAQFFPAVERRFSSGVPMRLLFQLHVPTQNDRNYQMEYLVSHIQDRTLRRTFTDSIAWREFQDGTLLKSKTIELEGLGAGDYLAVLSLRTEGSREVLASSTIPFKIGAEVPRYGLYFLSSSRKLANGGLAAYIRALESMAQNDQGQAAQYLRQSLDQNPSNSCASRALVQIYFNAGKFNNVTELYHRLGFAALGGTPETLAQVALSLWHTGEKEKAKSIVATAKACFPQAPFLSTIAGNMEQASMSRSQ